METTIQVGDRVRAGRYLGTLLSIEGEGPRAYCKVALDRLGGEGRWMGYLLRDLEPAEPHRSEPARAQHVGTCAHCGDDVPLRRTPRGWLCGDCA